MATVPEIIDTQLSTANSFIAQADGFINQVASLANLSLEAPIFSGQFLRSDITDGAKSELAAQRPVRPTFPTISATVPTVPEIDFTPVIPVEVLDFVKLAPALDLPTPPSSVLPIAPVAPGISDPVIPDAPEVSIPEAPTVLLPSLPSPPSVSLPTFDAQTPFDDLVAPTNTFQFFEQAYSSALLDETKAKLLSDLANGGFGIEVADELALFERARAREFDVSQQAVDELTRFHAARGFSIPPGDLTVAIDRAQQSLANKMSGISREIFLDRSDRFLKARQFALGQAKELENILIGFHNSIMERSLNAAKITLEMSIAVFNSLITRYNARVAAYQVEAQVFETKIRSALTQVEIYKAQLDGARLEVDVQKLAVEAFNAQLAGIQAVVNIYRTRMEAAGIQANIERTRLEAFRGLIDAYTAQVQAKVAEFGMYKAQIDGETAKITAFESEVRAYTAQVTGAKVKADVQVANLNAEVEQARTRLIAYQGEIEGFKGDLLAQTENLRAITDVYKTDITAFAAGVDALKSAYQLQVEELNANLQGSIKAADITVAGLRMRVEAQAAEAKLRLEASTFGAAFYSQVLGALFGSTTTLAAQVAEE
jgi:predicted  nucleic acid-binding Zn-ribbon protein